MENPYISEADFKEKELSEKNQKKIHERDIADMNFILSTPLGRRFLWALMGRCRVYSSVAASLDWMPYAAGQQDIGHYIQSRIIDADPESLVKMMLESKEGVYSV